MRSKIIVALTASAVVSLFASAAAADVILDSFTATPNVVSVGDPFTLNLQFHVTADPGYSNFQITSGSEALISPISGNLLVGFLIGSTSENFSTTNTANIAGTFSPNFSVTVNYVESYQQEVQTGSIPYSCGFFQTCYQPVYTLETFSQSGTWSLNGSTSLIVSDAAACRSSARVCRVCSACSASAGSVGGDGGRRSPELPAQHATHNNRDYEYAP